nr:hypothetical protein [Tanacetum cinerariifolium]
VDEQNTEEILDKEHSNSSGSTTQVQPSVVPISISEPDDPRTQSKPSIPYPSSFADALLLMPKFASTIKSLLANKDKLFELAKVLLNENCSAMLLKKLPEKLGDPELTPTRMTLELADRSITRPKGVVEDVFVKVGKFHFPTDFVVVDFEADPRVPLILGRSFLRTSRALIDVYGEEIALKVNEESITFNLNQTMRYSSTYDDTYVNRVDVIDIACKEFVQDILDFQYNPKSSSPTLVSDASISESNSCKEPIVKSSSLTVTPFGESDFFLKEIEDFLNHKISKNGLEVDRAKVDVIAKLPHPTTVKEYLENSSNAIAPVLPTEEPDNSVSMRDEHLNTILETASDEVIKSSVENLVPIPSDSEVTSDNESESDVPIN